MNAIEIKNLSMSFRGSCAVDMPLFSMIPVLTPLGATIMNAGLCLAGGALFSVGLGSISTFILKRHDLL